MALVFVVSVCAGRTLSAQAKPLDRPACEAIKQEHEMLLDGEIKAAIEKGAEWAKTNLGQSSLQKVKRVVAIEEQLAFRCRGVRLTTAVVISALRSVKPLKAKAAAGAEGIRRSTVPAPVKRPTMPPAQALSHAAKPSNRAAVEPANTVPSVVRPGAQSGAKKSNAAKANAPASTTANIKTPEATPADKAGRLPKVIRLQPSKTAKGTATGEAEAEAKKEKARRIKARQAKARQIRARKARKRKKRRRDVYVPPPANPGYQPSLRTP